MLHRETQYQSNNPCMSSRQPRNSNPITNARAHQLQYHIQSRQSLMRQRALIRDSNLVLFESSAGITQPRSVQTDSRCSRALRVLRLHCCSRRRANEALGHGEARGSVLVHVLDVELVHDWVKQDGLLVDCDDGVSGDGDPVVYDWYCQCFAFLEKKEEGGRGVKTYVSQK